MTEYSDVKPVFSSTVLSGQPVIINKASCQNLRKLLKLYHYSEVVSFKWMRSPLTK